QRPLLRALFRWPLVPPPPPVGARLEGERLRQVELPFVFEEVGEPRRLDLVAEVLASRAVERNRAKPIAGPRRPPAVPPRSDDEIVLFRAVVLLERVVDPDRSVEIFLVPPAGDAERRHLHRADLRDHRLALPEFVVIGV